MADAARQAAGTPGLRGHAPLTAPRFRVDPERLYEVSPRGTPWTEGAPDLAAVRLRRLRWWYGIGLLLNAVTWTAAGVALMLGGRAWGAGFGLLAVLTAPMLAAPALAEALGRLRARRRHLQRPDGFGRR